MKKVTDNKSFWKTVKPSFSDKSIKDGNIILIEDEIMISDEEKVAEIFNSFFGNVIQDLGIKPIDAISNIPDNTEDPVLSAISKYQSHPSIVKITNQMQNQAKFTFCPPNKEEIENRINQLDTSKR